MKYKEIIRNQLKGRLSPIASTYSGRGSNPGDLNSEMLEGIYHTRTS